MTKRRTISVATKRMISVATIVATIVGILVAIVITLKMKDPTIVSAAQEQQVRVSQINRVMVNLQEEKVKLQEENRLLSVEIEQIKGQEETNPLITAQLDQLKITDGTSLLKGSGIRMTIQNDGSDIGVLNPITAEDLKRIINTLRYADAEAISLNGQRIVANSSVVLSGSSTILINSVPISKIGASSYEFLAIGDQGNLADYLNNFEVIHLRQLGKKVDLVKEEVTIPAFKGGYYFNYSSRAGN